MSAQNPSKRAWRPIVAIGVMAAAACGEMEEGDPRASARIEAATEPSSLVGIGGTVGLTPATNPKVCAVVVTGPPDSFLLVDAGTARDFFDDVMGITVYSLRSFVGTYRAATYGELSSLLDNTVADRCDKVILYISAHGAGGTFDLQDAQATTPTRTAIGYDELAELLEYKFRARYPQMCIIVDACGSGSAIDPLQGRGFRGTIVTSTDEGRLCSANPIYGFRGSDFTNELFPRWEQGLASGPFTLAQAFADLIAGAGGGVLGPRPQTATLIATPLPLGVPDITLPGRFSTATVHVSSPPAFASLREVFQSHLEVAHPSVAVLTGGVFAAGQPAPVYAGAWGNGTTTYTLTVRGAGTAYRGTGTIRVGNPTFIFPPPPPPVRPN